MGGDVASPGVFGSGSRLRPGVAVSHTGAGVRGFAKLPSDGRRLKADLLSVPEP